MSQSTWLLYGAYGYTGALIAEAAVAAGQQPVLAGRNANKLAELAARLDLEYRVCGLDESASVRALLADFPLVLNCAGPFNHTAPALVDAALATGTHYLDITGEVSVLEQVLNRHLAAKQAGVLLLPGVGFDVVPSDCLARHTAAKVDQPHLLELAFASNGGISRGTAITAVEHASGGLWQRRDGQLQRQWWGPPQTVRFSDRRRTVLPITWGDLASAWRSTQIPNIRTAMALPPANAWTTALLQPLTSALMAVPPLKRLVQERLADKLTGPGRERREQGRSWLWARVSNRQGQRAETWLEGPEGYQMTLLAALECVNRTLAQQPTGALTPALAFGADLVMALPGVRRYDQLPLTPPA